MTDSDSLKRIKFVEFLEFIGRIAETVFSKNNTMKIYDKVYLTLQKMFKLLPAEVIEPQTEFDVDSESDNDEYLY